jgi:predicted nucleic acid-binding protein
MKIIRAFCLRGEPVHIAHRLRPQLVDPDDEFILETAYNGNADCIVTFNRSDFDSAGKRFGIETLSPSEALRKLRNR